MEDGPPAVAVGHIMLHVAEVARAAAFYERLGLRPIERSAKMAILEMRGGTHLLLFLDCEEYAEVPDSRFDLMVEDPKVYHAALAAEGIKLSDLVGSEVSGHIWFDLTDPDGHTIRVMSSHTGGRVV